MTGLSARNIKYMRAFADAWPDPAIVQQVVAQLPWGHNLRLLDRLKSAEERTWYARQTIQNGWSRDVLVHQIDTDLLARQGSALTNFTQTLPSVQSELAQQIIKDPYNFEFLPMGAELRERDLERGPIAHPQSLILELGKGFAYVGTQYPLDVGGQDYYLDLLFYHLRLRCFVVVELKIDDFKPEYAGKMNFYLSAVDEQLRHADDQPSIGIILCKGRNEVIVEYALRDTAKPMGVSQYQVSAALPAQLANELPTLEELSGEYPALAVASLRIEIERLLITLMKSRHTEYQHHSDIVQMLIELQQQSVSPPSTDRLIEVLQAINKAPQGKALGSDTADEAVRAGHQFLTELSELADQLN